MKKIKQVKVMPPKGGGATVLREIMGGYPQKLVFEPRPEECA